MIGSRYLNQMGSIRKRIKIPIFSKKKKVSSYHGSFVINKNVFFLKLITPKLNVTVLELSQVKGPMRVNPETGVQYFLL